MPLSLSIFNLMIEPLAESIRPHPHISGFKFNCRLHTMNLFSDDVILILTKPLTFLSFAHQVLQEFNELSYYKVNFSKSLILDLGIHSTTCKHLSSLLYYIQYLGMTLTSSTNKLLDANLKPLIHTIRDDTLYLAKMELSWAGRLAAFKMQVFPKILVHFLHFTDPIILSLSLLIKIHTESIYMEE